MHALASSPVTPSPVPFLLAPGIPYSDHVHLLLLKDTPKTLTDGQLVAVCAEMYSNNYKRIPHSHTDILSQKTASLHIAVVPTLIRVYSVIRYSWYYLWLQITGEGEGEHAVCRNSYGKKVQK